MEIPQLVQEIINHYLYLAQWKAGIRQLNEEYNKKFVMVRTNYDLVKINRLSYNDRNLSSIYYTQYMYIYNYKIYREVAKLPPRYVFSNTKEQLKSLYF